MCTLPRFNTCLLVSPPLSHYAPLVFYPFAPIHALFPSLRSRPSLPTCSSSNCYPRPGQYALLFPLTPSPACLPLPALPGFLATSPALLYWSPALFWFTGHPPCLLYWLPTLLYFTGHQPCSAVLLAPRLALLCCQPTCSALLAISPALLYWPQNLLCSTGYQPWLGLTGHEPCSTRLATSPAQPYWPPSLLLAGLPGPAPPPPFSACPCSAWALHSLCLLSHTLAATTGGKKAKRECP